MKFHLVDDSSSIGGWPVSGASCPLMDVVAASPGGHDWKFTKLAFPPENCLPTFSLNDIVINSAVF